MKKNIWWVTGDGGWIAHSSDKKGGKAFKRVNAVRPIAEKLGVKLP